MTSSSNRPPARKNAGVSVASYKNDKLHPRIEKALLALLERGSFLTTADVLVEMDILTVENLARWRKGQVPYLERVLHGNLSRLNRLLRILSFCAHDLNLTATDGSYPRNLRFSKSRDKGVERAYARNFRWPGKGPFHPPENTQP